MLTIKKDVELTTFINNGATSMSPAEGHTFLKSKCYPLPNLQKILDDYSLQEPVRRSFNLVRIIVGG